MDDEQREYFALNERKFRIHAFCHFCRTAFVFSWLDDTYARICLTCAVYICTNCTAETTTTFSENLRREIQTSFCTLCFKKVAEERNKARRLEPKLIDEENKEFEKMVIERASNRNKEDSQTLSANIKKMHSRLMDYYNQQDNNTKQSCRQKIQVESRIKQLKDTKERKIVAHPSNDYRMRRKARIVIPKHGEESIPEDKKIRGQKKKETNEEQENDETCVNINSLKVETSRNNNRAENTNKVDEEEKKDTNKKSPKDLESERAAKIKLIKKKCEKYLQYQKEHPEEFYKAKKRFN